jgi:hypothetical protein
MRRFLIAAASILALTLGTAALAQTSGTGTTEKSGSGAATSGTTSGSMSGTSGTTSGSTPGRNSRPDMACEHNTPSNRMSSSGPSDEKHGAAKPAESECGPAGTSGSSTSPGARGGGSGGGGH